ncbi:hypothetical protein [Leeia oryzae]|uniref:hypothetical protein n=1 Tax=Leeia oryzae TaxID=356662 RepID=UPI0012EAFCBC|nr:hypothetical protein [Leeia oryzae]
MNFDFPWLTKIPNEGKMLFSLEVQRNCELDISFDCTWSDSTLGSNLLLVIRGGELNHEEAKNLGFLPSNYGYYKYIKQNIINGHVCVNFQISSAVKEIWLVPFCTKEPVYIKELKSKYNQYVNIKVQLVSLIDKKQVLVMAPDEFIAINANLLKYGCSADCCIHFNKWFNSMDGFASRWGEHLGRDSIMLQSAEESFPAILHRGQPALLKIPKDISEWMYEIGDKSRNMISKARRFGYYYKDVDPSDVGQGIYEVRTSDPMRQGRSIPEYFYTNPPKFVIDRSKVSCRHHDELFIGIFLGEQLVSYITIFVFGQLAEVNHILCHSDHLGKGVMNYNLYCAVNCLIKNNPEVKYLNYLYVSNSKKNGVDLFKKSMGFKSQKLFIYDGRFDLAGFETSVTHLNVNAANKEQKAYKKEIIKKYKPNATYPVVSGEITSINEISEKLTIDASHIIFLENPAPSDFVKFWSSGIRNIASEISVGAFIAIHFPKEIPLNDKHGIADYLTRRFKANPNIEIEGLRCGFKGSAFRLVALFDCVGWGDDNSLLVLEKV